jgi:hypothetical protein
VMGLRIVAEPLSGYLPDFCIARSGRVRKGASGRILVSITAT